MFWAKVSASFLHSVDLGSRFNKTSLPPHQTLWSKITEDGNVHLLPLCQTIFFMNSVKVIPYT